MISFDLVFSLVYLNFTFFFFFWAGLRFRSITEQYYRKADGILAMYDLTHATSFTAVRGWMDSVKVSPLDGKSHAKQFVPI